MMRQASHRALVARQRRVQEIDRETRTLLTQLAAGTDPQELQKDAAVTEEQLRDFIRADRLTIPPLRQTVREARSRGVRVRLADDSAGIHDLRTLINEANTIIAKAAPGDEVTVRALPPGKSHLGSVLISVDGQDTLHWVDLDTGIKKR